MARPVIRRREIDLQTACSSFLSRTLESVKGRCGHTSPPSGLKMHMDLIECCKRLPGTTFGPGPAPERRTQMLLLAFSVSSCALYLK